MAVVLPVNHSTANTALVMALFQALKEAVTANTCRIGKMKYIEIWILAKILRIIPKYELNWGHFGMIPPIG